MKERTTAKLDYIKKAMNGAFSPAQAKVELDQMEKQYGELVFTPGKANKKPRPWTKNDLDDLWKEAVAGAGSRDFMEYMAEMGWEVKQTERREKRIKIFGILAAVVAAVAVIVAVVRLLRG